MGDYKADLWIAQRNGVKIDGVGVTHVKQRGKSEFLANSDAEYSTMDKRYGVMRSGEIKERRHALVMHGIAMHGGKEAEAMEPAGFERLLNALGGIVAQGVDHGISVKALRERGYGGGDRVVIVRNAGDNGATVEAMTVEFGVPFGRELGGIFRGNPPAQNRFQGFHWDLALPG